MLQYILTLLTKLCVCLALLGVPVSCTDQSVAEEGESHSHSDPLVLVPDSSSAATGLIDLWRLGASVTFVSDVDSVGWAGSVIASAMQLYDQELLKQSGPSTILLLNGIHYNGADLGGTYGPTWVAIAVPAEDSVESRNFVERTLHHEVISVLVSHPATTFPFEEWKNVNGVSVVYAGSEHAAIKDNPLVNQWTMRAWKDGFASEYGRTSLENDISTVAELALTQSAAGHDFGCCPKLEEKITLVRHYVHGRP